MSVELLPCPFCGRKPYETRVFVIDQLDFVLNCGCGIRTTNYNEDTKDKMYAAWNRRALPEWVWTLVACIEDNIKAGTIMVYSGDKLALAQARAAREGK